MVGNFLLWFLIQFSLRVRDHSLLGVTVQRLDSGEHSHVSFKAKNLLLLNLSNLLVLEKVGLKLRVSLILLHHFIFIDLILLLNLSIMLLLSLEFFYFLLQLRFSLELTHHLLLINYLKLSQSFLGLCLLLYKVPLFGTLCTFLNTIFAIGCVRYRHDLRHPVIQILKGLRASTHLWHMLIVGD